MSYAGDSGEMNAIAVPSDEMRTVQMKSGTIGTFIATGALTEGRYGLYRWAMPPRAGGAGGHFHRTFSEAFYVLDGAPEFYDGRSWTRGGPGFYLHVPEGSIHGFRNETDEPATFLILFAPGGAREGYFEALAEIGAGTRTMSKSDWAELYERFDQVNVE